MKRLGVVENLSYDGTVLVRAERSPRTGSRVVDARSRVVGKVSRVFGPVREPFVAVRPETRVPVSLIGSDVYTDEGDHARQEQKNRRGRGSH